MQVKGSFSSLEDLLTVPGIGKNVLEQNKNILVCESEQSPMDMSTSSHDTMEDTDTESSSLGEAICSHHGFSNNKTSSRRSSRRFTNHDPNCPSSSTSSCCGNVSSGCTASCPRSASISTVKCGSPSSKCSPNLRRIPSNEFSHCGSPSSKCSPNLRQVALNDSSNPSSRFDIKEKLCKNVVNHGGSLIEDRNLARLCGDKSENRPINYSGSKNSRRKSFKNSDLLDECSMQEDNDFFTEDLDDTGLQKLRVRENSNDDGEISSNEDSFDALPPASTVSPTHPIAPMAGSDTPFEESVDNQSSTSGLMLSQLELAKSRTYGASPFDCSTSSSSNFNVAPSDLAPDIHGRLKVSRRRKLCSNINFSNSSTEDGSSNSLSSNKIKLTDVPSNLGLLHFDFEQEVLIVNDSEEERFDEDFDRNISIDCNDVSMEESISFNDKKPVKRKYEIVGEHRPLLPVKKSCKSDEASPPKCRPTPPPPCLPGWLDQYQAWTHTEKLAALDCLVEVCDLSQVSCGIIYFFN